MTAQVSKVVARKKKGLFYELLRWSNPWSVPEWNGGLHPHTVFQTFCRATAGSDLRGKAFIDRSFKERHEAGITADFEGIFAADIKDASRFEKGVENNNPTILCSWMVLSTKKRPGSDVGGQLPALLRLREVQFEETLTALLGTTGSAVDPLTAVLDKLPVYLDLGDPSVEVEAVPLLETLTAGQEEEKEAADLISSALPELEGGALKAKDHLRRIEQLRLFSRALLVAVTNLALSAPWRILGLEPPYLLSEGGRVGEDRRVSDIAAKRLEGYVHEHLEASADVVTDKLMPVTGPKCSIESLKAYLMEAPGAQRMKLEESRAQEIADALWDEMDEELVSGDRSMLGEKMRAAVNRWLQESKAAKDQTYATNLRRYLRAAGLSVPSPARPAFEAEVLPILTRGLIKKGEGGSLLLEEFVDLLREHLGLVVGFGQLESEGVYTEEEKDARYDRLFACGKCWKDKEEMRRDLTKNQEMFERRLVLAGLAKRFSDSRTEVFREHS